MKTGAPITGYYQLFFRHSIPHTHLGQNIAWGAGILLDLTAKVCHIDAQGMALIAELPPYFADERIVGQHLSRVD